MVRYQQLERDPATRDLFKKRITTLKGFRQIFESSYLLALDTEHVAITSERDRVLHQVGLAFTKTLKSRHPACPGREPGLIKPRRRLRYFFEDNNMEGLTLNVNTSKELGDDVLRVGRRVGGHVGYLKGMPTRRSHRFGVEKFLDIGDLELFIVEFLQDLPKDKHLVLIGFGMEAEWTYLSTNFPAAMPFFSAWIDLRDIVVDIASSPTVFSPSLFTLIKLFGYFWQDVKPGRASADNAGDDVVTTFALAHALLDEKNHETLRFEHECFRISRSGRIGSFYDASECFTATVRTKGKLPLRLSSRFKLARQFFDFHPMGTALMSSEMGLVAFRSQDGVDRFIGCVDGMVLHTGETLSAQRYIHANPNTPEVEKLKEEKRRKRRIKKEAFNEEVVELGGLFS
ncbi:uncharacterized protein FPRO_09936 [Fusarium proliferatum ET1]|uniref:Uncharacterized protein n=1 Tax=Fusarium proliferatum (strain ET1) TaxID=1227346 RepID=A0A1L7VQ98_FUSPR|nr:uncharacterized protein FPRO_09936 [Fusarium proliferatum ET1]CZR42633.1 uncharacterized protein FPRO_09936 [Fusarium proliferatum ET1]